MEVDTMDTFDEKRRAPESLLAELFREAVREHRIIHSQFVDTCDVCCLLDMVAERLK
jgi:hypothetical protein